MSLTIECKYTCNLCGLHRVIVAVPVRKDGEDVKDWIEKIALPSVCEDHAKRSPSCNPRTLAELMIPMDGRPMIGGPQEN